MYLALGAASLYGLIRPPQAVYRVLGIAWTVFGVLHFAYHITHLGHLTGIEVVSQIVMLVIAVLLGLALMVSRRSRTEK